MGWTKREVLAKAFSLVGLAGYEYDLTGEELSDALSTMDAMLAEWDSNGIRVGYALPSTQGGSDINSQSGVPDRAYMAVAANVACLIAPSYGKVPSREVKQAAKSSYDTLLARSLATPPQTQLPGSMPAGSGHRWRISNQRPFLARPVDPLLAGPDGEMEFS
jgi:hypothetical protein